MLYHRTHPVVRDAVQRFRRYFFNTWLRDWLDRQVLGNNGITFPLWNLSVEHTKPRFGTLDLFMQFQSAARNCILGFQMMEGPGWSTRQRREIVNQIHEMVERYLQNVRRLNRHLF